MSAKKTSKSDSADSYRIAKAKADAKLKHAQSEGYEYVESEPIEFGSDCPLIPVTIESPTTRKYTQSFLPDTELVTESQLKDSVKILLPERVAEYGSADAYLVRQAARAVRTDFRNALAARMTAELGVFTQIRRLMESSNLSKSEKLERANALLADFAESID